MAFTVPGVPFKLNAADMGGLGGFDLGNAIRSGLGNANLMQEARYKPRNLENEAYGKELSNKINEAKSEYARQNELANLQHTQAGTGHLGALTALSREQLKMLPYDQRLKVAQTQQAMYELQQQQQLNNLLSGGSQSPGNNVPASMENNQPSSNKQSLTENIGQGLQGNANEQILSPGNPALTHLNDIWEKFPQHRKAFEKRGIKKTETVKFDPKTGTSSVITTFPNGEVRVRSSIPNDDMSPATIKSKSDAQKTLSAITNARPIIEDIIKSTLKGEIPGQLIGKYFTPDTQAEYESDVIQSSDTLAGALGYPATDTGLHQAQQTVLRKQIESDKGYEKRLRKLLKDMDQREKTAKNTLRKGFSLKNNAANNSGNFEKAGTPSAAREAPPGTIGLYKNGELFFIPPNKVDEALSEGFSYG